MFASRTFDDCKRLQVTLVLLLLFVVEDDIENVSVTAYTTDRLTECVLEAGALNALIEAARDESDEDALERRWGSHPRLRWVDADEVDDAEFRCEVALMQPW